MNILIVEDEEFNQIVIKEMLTLLYPELNIDSAENGLEALDLLKKNQYHLILSDIDMPKMNGNQFLKVIKEELNLVIPVIAVTAYAITGDREKLLLFGFDNYIAKPIEIEQLKKIMDGYIHGKDKNLDIKIFSSIESIEYEEDENYVVFITDTFKSDHQEFFKHSKNSIKAGVVVPHIIINNQLISEGIALLKLKDPNTFTKIVDMNNEVDAIIEKIQQYKIQSLFLFVDGLSSQFEPFIAKINEHIEHDEIAVIGSGVGVKSLTPTPVVFDNTGIYQDYALVIGTNFSLNAGVNHGWKSLYGPLVVTKSKDNIIYELNGQPAFEIYQQMLKEVENIDISVENFFDIAKAHPLGIMTFSDSEFIIRDPIAVNNDGSIVIVSSVKEYDSLFIMKGEKETLIDSSVKLAEQVFSKSISKTSILFDCISRVLFLEEEFQKELSALHPFDNDEHKLFGLTCVGEITNIQFNSIKVLNKTTLLGTIS